MAASYGLSGASPKYYITRMPRYGALAAAGV